LKRRQKKMSGGYHDEDIITGHKKHVKRLNNKKDWGAELEHYRKNYTADLRVYNEEMSVIRSKEKKFKQEKLNEEREKELEYKLVGKHQKAIEQKKAKEQQEKEEAEAERQKNVKIRDEKMREKLHAETHELRELQAKIDAAYMNKERAAQVQRNEAARKQAADEAEENRKFINNHAAFEERAKQEAAIARVEAARKLQADLENQLIEKEKNAQLAYEQFLKEKKMIDDVVKKIEMEDAQSKQDAINKIEDHRTFIGNRDTYNQQREMEEKARDEEEDRKNREFKEEKQRQAEQVISEKQAKASNLDRVQQHLRLELTKKQKEKEDYERLIQELAVSELEEKESQNEKDLADKVIRTRFEMQKDHFEQLEQKEMRIQAEAAEEETLRQQMLAKFAEDDRIELMNAQKRRMKQLEHKRAAENLLAARRERRSIEIAQKQAERDAEQKEAELKAKLVEEERQKLIAKHAQNLLGFLPKGVIRDYDDLEPLGDDYKQAYKPNLTDDEQ